MINELLFKYLKVNSNRSECLWLLYQSEIFVCAEIFLNFHWERDEMQTCIWSPATLASLHTMQGESQPYAEPISVSVWAWLCPNKRLENSFMALLIFFQATKRSLMYPCETELWSWSKLGGSFSSQRSVDAVGLYRGATLWILFLLVEVVVVVLYFRLHLLDWYSRVVNTTTTYWPRQYALQLWE